MKLALSRATSAVRLGLVARADEGGLGIQTWEMARHLRPARVLVVDVWPRRGTFDPARFDGAGLVRIAPNPPSRDDWAWLLDGVDAVLTVEGCYDPSPRDLVLADLCYDRGIRLYVHVNPELWPAVYVEQASLGRVRVLAPTVWETNRIGPHTPMPMPVATDRIVGTVRTREPRTFLHVSAPAMLDRNGTRYVLDAARHYQGPRIRVLISGPAAPMVGVRGSVEIEPLADVRDYWDRYTDEIDAVILPRRYGGLSLVAQEAMAAGLPVICLNRVPENTWPGTRTAPIIGSRHHPMKGGPYEVWACDAEGLAATIRTHVESDPEPLSRAALDYARSISWDALLPRWQEVLAT